MSIVNSAISSGATVAATGGTSFTFTADGQTAAGAVHVANAAITDFRIRPNAWFRSKVATVLDKLKGTFSKGKRSVVYVKPKILASGEVVYPLIRIELEDHPEMSLAEITALVTEGAQLLCDSDYTSFWTTGALA